MTTESFTNAVLERIRQGIKNISGPVVSDIYALSFFVSLDNDDYRLPMVTVGYNTASNVESKDPEDQREARWNYAFWLQNQEVVIGGDGDALVESWVKSLPDYYTDEEEESDSTLEKGECIKSAFVEVLIKVAKRIHNEGIIEQKFSSELPIIIHELEYYYAPVDWTRAANPSGVATEFEQWVESLSDNL